MLLKTVQQSLLAISSTRKRIARDSLFQAFHHIHLFFGYIQVTPAGFTPRRITLESAQAKMLKLASPDVYALADGTMPLFPPSHWAHLAPSRPPLQPQAALPFRSAAIPELHQRSGRSSLQHRYRRLQSLLRFRRRFHNSASQNHNSCFG